MIKFYREDYQAILANPKAYISDDQDIALVQIVPANNPNNPTLMMVGQDPWDGRYLIVVEDNDVSEDIYPEDISLYDAFMHLYEELASADNLMDVLYKASTEANVPLVLRDGDGNVIEPKPEVITVLNNILEQAYLPSMVDSIIAAGYRHVDNEQIADWKDVLELLVDEYIQEGIVPAYQEYDQCIELDKETMDLVHKILLYGYIPFIAKATVNAGFAIA